MAERNYKNEAQQNLIRVVEYLAEDILQAKTQKELAEALDISKDQAFRTLWNLKDRGWIEESANGFRLSPRLTMIADRLRQAVADTLRSYLGQGVKEVRSGILEQREAPASIYEFHPNNVSEVVSIRGSELGLAEE